jgi:hypothetical protein
MGPDHLVFLVPIVAIVSGIGASVIKRYLAFKERELEMRLRHSNGGDADITRQLQELRQEIAHLRDTTTSYDLSIDHQLQQLERRMQYMENKNIDVAAASNAETVQQLGQLR